jgi:hypothetical protein
MSLVIWVKSLSEEARSTAIGRAQLCRNQGCSLRSHI